MSILLVFINMLLKIYAEVVPKASMNTDKYS